MFKAGQAVSFVTFKERMHPVDGVLRGGFPKADPEMRIHGHVPY